MSYTPTTWQTGDTITANKLNKIETELVALDGDVGDLKSAIGENGANILAAYPTDNASGAVASFADGAAVPVKSLVVNIEPVQSGSGDPSPDNVRPISGHTGVNVWRTGVNVWDEDWELGRLDYDKNSQTWGQNVNTTAQIRSKNYISVIPGQNYYCKAFTGAAVYAIYYGADKSPVPTISNQGFQDVANVSFQVPSNAHYIRFYVPSTTVYGNNISFNYPSTDTEYHAYTGQTLPISWQSEAGTIYGGTLDVLTGVLTVDRASKPMDEMTWVYDATNTRFYSTSIVGQIKKGTSDWLTDLLCSAYSPANGVSQNGTISEYASTGYIYCKDTAYTNATLFSISLVGQTLVYPLATPQTVQLDPAQLSTLLGANNIWADTGDTTVNYRADTTLYIDKLTGSTEEDMIADAPIASGKYFLVGNRLFLSTASIAAGATLTPGTNCTETNLAAALNALNS